MKQSFLKIEKNKLHLPKELFSFLVKPKYIFIYSHVSENSWLLTFNYRLLLKVLIRLLKGKQIIIAKYHKDNKDSIVFNTTFSYKKKLFETKYRLTNYETRILLSPAVNADISTNRQNFWESIAKYHEHNKVEEQKTDVIERTKWLSELILSFNPKSVLELGCGGGRNLYFLHQQNPDCKLYGVEVNPRAIAMAKKQLGESLVMLSESIYELQNIESNSIDIVFTSGVLMHIPHDKVLSVIKDMKRIARKKIIHYELHGPAHDFDFHRYPRNYKNLYPEFNTGNYQVFDRNDIRNSGTESFHHSLLIIDK